jgi:hypothetical protein
MASGAKADTARKKPPGKKAKKLSQAEQSERFKQAAQELEADDTGNAFDQALKSILPSKGRP